MKGTSLGYFVSTERTFSRFYEKREREKERGGMLLACFIVKGERSRMMSFGVSSTTWI